LKSSFRKNAGAFFSLALWERAGVRNPSHSTRRLSIPQSILLFIVILLTPFSTFTAEVIPPVPTHYFNDYANVISPAVGQELNTRLETFEKETSSQIVVAIYPKMQSDSSIEDYTVRVAQKWAVGQKDKRNGAVLFLFVADRKMFLQVGYGLEGAIPDATAKQITEFEIKPPLQRGDYDAGLRAGVTAILQAAKGEYKGTGRTVNQNRSRRSNQLTGWMPLIFGLFILFSIIGSIRRGRRGRIYHRGGGIWGPIIWSGGNDWGGGSSGGGGGSWDSSSSGGGFSSGGGDFGGGGAGSSW
jgi:uncharacterized protein